MPAKGGKRKAAAPVSEPRVTRSSANMDADHDVNIVIASDSINCQSNSELYSGGKAKKRTTVNDVLLMVNGMQGTANANNARVTRLEDKVDAMSGNLDFIVNAMKAGSVPPHAALTAGTTSDTSTNRDQVPHQPYTRAPTVQSVSQPPLPAPADYNTQDRLVHTQHSNSVSLPPPNVLRAEENTDGFIDRLVAREDYRGNQHVSGKMQPHNESLIAKPYMYADRDGAQNRKQKLDIRASLTMIEYINASLLLLQDDSAYNKADLPAILRHVTYVSTDAISRPWWAVRKWSQHIWDSVENGRCKWSDHAYIQEERVRMSFTSGPPSNPNTGPTRHTIAHATEALLCRDFNSSGGCKHNASHDEGAFRLLHSCSFCDSVGRRSNHSIQKCRAKQEATRGQNTPSQYHQTYDHKQWNQASSRNAQYGGQYQNHQDGNAHGRAYQQQYSQPKNV